ncbi:MAG TPA: hypothetical protein VEK08_04910 [Planctomycetota bacterium]|nr:hypothetical protein [Planctomycetota bacterium]
MNWRPRFSLRSLLLGVLLIGSGALLWQNSAPWVRVRMFAADGNRNVPCDGYQRLVAFSPDGSRLCYCGETTTPQIVDLATGTKLFRLGEPANAAYCVSYSPDGHWIVAAGRDSVRIWNASTGAEQRAIERADRIANASFSPDSKQVIAASYNGAAYVWDRESGREVAKLFVDPGEDFHPWATQCAVFSPDGKWVATINHLDLRLWDTATWKLHSSAQLPWTVFGATFSPDSTRLLTAGDDGSLRHWRINPLEMMHTIKAPDQTRHMHAVEFAPGGEKYIAASCDGRLSIWKVFRDNPLAYVVGPPDLISASLSPNGENIAAAARSGAVWLYSKRRPEYWWGLAWLPEFWLTLALGTVFCWSVIGDRRLR